MGLATDGFSRHSSRGHWVVVVEFSRAVVPALDRWRPGSGFQANALLVVALVAGGAGFHHSGPYGIRIAPIGSMVYYTLAQNPVLFAAEALRIAVVSRNPIERRANTEAMPYAVAVRTAQQLLGPTETFVDARYPFVRTTSLSRDGVRLSKPANILLVFLEGLDRRYLGQTYGEVKGTPFLDRLKQDSVYFENFFRTACKPHEDCSRRSVVPFRDKAPPR